jgi:hypothetical protein
MSWSLIFRRIIVVIAVVLAAGVGYLQYLGLTGRKRAREFTFIEDATAVPNAYRRALGPAPPLLRLTIEPSVVTAQVITGERQTTPYLFERERGFVVASPAEALDEATSQRHAFVLSVVDFVALRDVLDEAKRELGVEPVRVVIDRVGDADHLRCRAYAPAAQDGGVRVAERTLRARVDKK